MDEEAGSTILRSEVIDLEEEMRAKILFLDSL